MTAEEKAEVEVEALQPQLQAELVEMLRSWQKVKHDVGPEGVVRAIARLSRGVAYDLIREREKPAAKPAGAGAMEITRGDWLKETVAGLKALGKELVDDEDYPLAKQLIAAAELCAGIAGTLEDAALDDVPMPESVLA